MVGIFQNIHPGSVVWFMGRRVRSPETWKGAAAFVLPAEESGLCVFPHAVPCLSCPASSQYLLLFIYFLATPTACGNSQARDQTCTTAPTQATAVTMLVP